ncbi:RcnB family protein [Rhodanobacter sp. C01]|uniref:RcnB family protein n=1 Tax=Rhodanobacter sp. C01 TaxID=1945856 RepID=UPI000984EF43|nr:RcnB family protein [Rhodanobacter sp. C01]OOG49422.1 transmembrane signal peptide protein [Rhodanobacter sp. C01]
MKLINHLLVATALLATTSVVLAAPDRDNHGRHDRDHHGHNRGHDDHRHGDDHGRYGYHDGGPRNYGRPHWQRGHRYDGPTYVVRDYGHYRLRQPPRGYHWVRANNDFLLVAVATGIILDVALH